MRLRPDFDKELKEQFMDILRSKREALESLGKKDPAKEMMMLTQVFPKVVKFIQKLKHKVLEKKAERKRKHSSFTQTKYLLLKDNELLV